MEEERGKGKVDSKALGIEMVLRVLRVGSKALGIEMVLRVLRVGSKALGIRGVLRVSSEAGSLELLDVVQ